MNSYRQIVICSFLVLFLGGCSSAKDDMLRSGRSDNVLAGNSTAVTKNETTKPALDAYRAAAKKNTVESYAKFIEQHPKGKYVNRAKRKKQALLKSGILKSAKAGDADVVRRLIKAGADINTTDRFGNTPLHLAIDNRNPRVANLLIEDGADIDAVGAFGNTPLHLSLYSGQDDTTTRLLAKGADKRIRNKYGLVADEMQRLPEIEHLVVSTARLIDRNGRWKQKRKGRSGYNRLRRRKNMYVVNSIILKVIYRDDIRLQVLLLAVKLGIPGSEQNLTDVLQDYGNRPMAEDFLNSGSGALASGARAWAAAHGYSVHTGPGSHRSTWGRF